MGGRAWACVIALGLGALGRALAGEDPPSTDAIVATQLGQEVAVPLVARFDGPAWQQARVFDLFVERWPVTGAKPPQRTTVRAVYDRNALYVGIEAFDSDPSQIRAPYVRHDAVDRTQDFVAVYIDTGGKRHSAQFFRVSASGSTGDGMHTAVDDNEDLTPDFDYFAVAERHGSGYNALLQIPFSSLRFAAGGPQSWRIFVIRRLPRTQFHLLTSALVPEDAPSYIATMQEFHNVVLPDDVNMLTVRPVATARTRKQEGPARSSSHRQTDLGVDIKWRPAARLVFDATINPDFSQVELDIPQLSRNTRFALYIDEKRPFFLESSDLLRSPTDALYTRSLTQPRWGARGTFRGASSAATAFIVNDKGGGEVLIPGPFGTGSVSQPAFAAFSGRGLTEVESGRLGMVLSARRYAGDRGDNLVVGPDVELRLPGSVTARGQWLHAQTSAQPASTGTLEAGPTTQGNQVLVELKRQTDRTRTEALLSSVSSGFRNDAGFVEQSGFDRLRLRQEQVWRPNAWINEVDVALTARQTSERGTRTIIDRQLTPGVTLLGPHDLQWTIEYRGWRQQRPDRESDLLRERAWYSLLSAAPASWMPLLKVEGVSGKLVDVVTSQVRPGGSASLVTRVRPMDRLEVEGRHSVAWVRNDGRRVGEETASRVLGVFNFDAQQSVRALFSRTRYVREAESVVSAERSRTFNASLTYGWRRSLASTLYLGAARLRSDSADVPRQTEFFVKWQFELDRPGSL